MPATPPQLARALEGDTGCGRRCRHIEIGVVALNRPLGFIGVDACTHTAHPLQAPPAALEAKSGIGAG